MTQQGKMWTWIIVAIIVIAGAVYFFMNNNSGNSYTSPEQGTQSNETTGARGRVVFSVTDAAVNMSTISEIDMKVSKVEMHSAADSWITVSTTPQTFNLLLLNAKSQSALLADSSVQAGTYDQIRLMVDSVTVKTKAGATKTAKLPSGVLKIDAKVVVNTDNTASVNFDFIANKSLHATGNGDFIFAPVVKTSSKSNSNVSVDANNVVSISGGKEEDSKTEGMDVDGNVKLDFEIDDSSKLILDSTSKTGIRIGGGAGSSANGNADVNLDTKDSIY
jgi:hypothetical protein